MNMARLPRALWHCLVAVFSILMLFPLIWLVGESFMKSEYAFMFPPSWMPSHFTTRNFADMAQLVPFVRMAINSLVVAGVGTTAALLTSVMAAYAFSRLNFPFKGPIFGLMLAALMVPMQMTIIPVFVLMRSLNLVDTLGALILPVAVNVFSIFFFRQYFNSIPKDFDEAAMLDGAGHVWILFRMIVPMSKPAIAAMAILNFEAIWNNYFSPLILIRSQENMTLPLGLVTLQSGQSGSSVAVFAAITAVVIPALIVFLVFQRSFIASVAGAGVKG